LTNHFGALRRICSEIQYFNKFFLEHPPRFASKARRILNFFLCSLAYFFEFAQTEINNFEKRL